MEKPTVATPLPAWQTMSERMSLPEALMGGTPAMRAKGQTYLPREPREDEAGYSKRLSRTVLFNAFKRAVNSLTGRVFAKPLDVADDVPPALAYLIDNADQQGSHLNVFAKRVFEIGLTYGLCHVLVEMPKAIPGATLQAEREAGIRPYLVRIHPQELIGWRFDGPRLVQIRILQTIERNDGDYGVVSVQQVRVIEVGRFAVHEKNAKGEWAIVDEGETSFSEVPLATFYAARTGLMQAEPPLEDLAYLNVTHWQSSSDQRNILHIARVPLLFGKNLADSEITIAPDNLIKGPAESDLKYVEHAGNAIKAGYDDLESIEEKMRILSMEPMLPRSGAQTATARAMDSIENTSQLQAMSVALSDCLQNAFLHAAKAVGEKSGGTITANTDLALSSRDGTDMQTLLQARLAGEISRETLWDEMKRRNVLVDAFDADVESERLADEPIAAIPPPTGKPKPGSF